MRHVRTQLLKLAISASRAAGLPKVVENLILGVLAPQAG